MSQYKIQNPSLTYLTNNIYIMKYMILQFWIIKILLLYIIILCWLNISTQEFFSGLTSNMRKNICHFSSNHNPYFAFL